MSLIAWPMAIIDFEASSLDLRGYPIEVGVAICATPSDPIVSWSMLIRPTPEWLQHGQWSVASARTHGIKGRDLQEQGLPPEKVANALNAALKGIPAAWCDGARYDAQWCSALFAAGGVNPEFLLRDFHHLALRLGKAAREKVFTALEAASRHRAREDAEQLLAAFREAHNDC